MCIESTSNQTQIHTNLIVIVNRLRTITSCQVHGKNLLRKFVNLPTRFLSSTLQHTWVMFWLIGTFIRNFDKYRSKIAFRADALNAVNFAHCWWRISSGHRAVSMGALDERSRLDEGEIVIAPYRDNKNTTTTNKHIWVLSCSFWVKTNIFARKECTTHNRYMSHWVYTAECLFDRVFHLSILMWNALLWWEWDRVGAQWIGKCELVNFTRKKSEFCGNFLKCEMIKSRDSIK